MIQDRKLCVRTVGLVVFCLAYFVGAAPVMAQQLKLFPAQGPQSGAPTPFLDACFNLSQWAYPRAYTTHLGVYDRILADYADSHPTQVSSCFSQLDTAGIQFAMGTGALKEWCTTAQDCFNAEEPDWDSLTTLGGTIAMMELDEPLTAVLMNPDWPLSRDYNYAVAQTAEFIRLVRQKYPNVTIVEQEAYPAISASVLESWVRDLKSRCIAIGTRPPDYFELDHDWHAPYGSGTFRWNWYDISNMKSVCHGIGVGFSVIFWAADASNSNSDSDWYNGVMYQGAMYQIHGIMPDYYSLNSWLNIPHVTVPGTTCSSSFMGTAYSFLTWSYFPHCASGGPDCMSPGQVLEPYESVESADGRFVFVYQGDGNLVLYDQSWTPHWASNTAGTSLGVVEMQGDGNLVLYDASWTPRWSSHTHGNLGSHLAVQNDGNVVVYSPGGPPLWETDTDGHCP